MPRNVDTSFVDNLTPNFAQLFLDRVAASGSLEAYRYPKGDGWESATWKQAGDRVTNLAAGLISLGLQPEQRVGIASSTRYEWILADLAIMCAGAATTTVYPSTNEDDTAYILADSECKVVFAEDDDQIAKLKNRKSELPHVGKVVTFCGLALARALPEAASGPAITGLRIVAWITVAVCITRGLPVLGAIPAALSPARLQSARGQAE